MYSIVAVVAVIAVMVIMFMTRSTGPTDANASEAALQKVVNVPDSTFTAVGVPADVQVPEALPPNTPPIEQDGKPVVLYVGAEFCPYCAAERWPMVVALSRFGTFSGLSATTSAPPPETAPNTPTLTFHGTSYASDVVKLSAVETATNKPTGNGFEPLDTPTDFQQNLFDTYNTSGGSIPFAMIGNLYRWVGASYPIEVLKGLSFNQIADQLADPTTDVSKAIVGSANLITGEICQLTGGQPSEVCSTPEVQAAYQKLGVSP
jgi:thiol-disulfide isomerase/thioredoxin